MTIDDVALNDFATLEVWGVAVVSHVLVLIYGFGSPWWRSLLGITIFAKWLSVMLVFDFLIARRLFGEFGGYGLWAVIVYGFMLLAFLAVVVEVVIERRHPADEVTHKRKVALMAEHAAPSTTARIIDGQPTTVDTETGAPTARPTAKVLAGAITTGSLVVVVAILTAVTPDLLGFLGPWAPVGFAGVVALAGFLASYAKRP